MSEQAIIAIRAAQMRKSIGPFAARRYIQKRKVPMGLYRLACQLHAASVSER